MLKIVGVVANEALSIESDGEFSYDKIKLTENNDIVSGLPCYVPLVDSRSIEVLEAWGCVIKTGFNIKIPPLSEGETYLGLNMPALSRKELNELKKGKWEAVFPILQCLKKREVPTRKIKYFCSGISLTKDSQLNHIYETKLTTCPQSLKGIPCFVQNFFDDGPFIDFCKALGATEFINEKIELNKGETALAFPVLGITLEEKWSIKTLLDRLPDYQHALQITLL